MELLKIGTKVFDIRFGWGEISSIDCKPYSYKAIFSKEGNIFYYDMNGKAQTYINPTLSLTEYDLINGGFTPLSDYNKPKKFDVGYFWDYEESGHELFYSQILKIEESEYITSSFRTFKHFSKEVPEWFKKELTVNFKS
jgi:hypothetical protein